MQYELEMKHNLESNTYQYDSLDKCCEHILKMQAIAQVVAWELTFNIYQITKKGVYKHIPWPCACLQIAIIKQAEAELDKRKLEA